VRVMKVSAASRPAGGNAGCCVKGHRTELGIKCHAAALGLGRPDLAVIHDLCQLGIKGLEQRRSRSRRGQAPTPSAVVSLSAFAYCEDDGERLRLRASLP
jgi:hypothetical protein